MTSPVTAGPEHFDVTVYILVDDFGRIGHAYLETDNAGADEHNLIDDILRGQFDRVECIVAFNTSEGWAGDVTAQIAREVVDAAFQRGIPIQGGARDWVDRFVETTDPRRR